jgi:hypothetical protein
MIAIQRILSYSNGKGSNKIEMETGPRVMPPLLAAPKKVELSGVDHIINMPEKWRDVILSLLEVPTESQSEPTMGMLKAKEVLDAFSDDDINELTRYRLFATMAKAFDDAYKYDAYER